MPIRPTADIRADVDGLIGEGFRFHADVEFDPRAARARLFEPYACTGDQVVYWPGAYAVTPLLAMKGIQGGPFVTVTVNGVPLRGLMSSTSPFMALCGRGASAGPDKAAEGRRVLGDAPTLVRVDTVAVAVGDEIIRNTQLRVSDLLITDYGQQAAKHYAGQARVPWPQMVLGGDFFRAHRLYFSTEQRKVCLSYEGGPVFDAPVTSSPTGRRQGKQP